MENFRQIENNLYGAMYGIPRKGDANAIWNSIKSNNEILAEAIEVGKDKLGERDLVKGLAICNCMLIDYKEVNPEIYQKLVDLIYSNTEIARIVLDGASNGGYSYLLMTLWNPNLKLTEEQKQFAVSEAIAHGTSPFDIRYQILRNVNWTIEEKKKLVYDFWIDAEDYDEFLEQWEWEIINDEANYKGALFSQLDKAELYDYTYQELLDFYGNKETTDNIWNEIKFCRTMHILRPQQWEMEKPYQKSI